MSLLLLIVGSMALIFGLFFLGISPLTQPSQRSGLIAYGGWMASAGVLFLAARFTLFILPDWIRRRNSPSYRRRREMYARQGPRPAPDSARKTARAGAALLWALALTGILSALLIQAHAAAREQAARTRAALDRTALRQAAAEAVRLAVQRLADDEDLAADHPSEPWARPTEYETPLGVSIRCVIRDEQSRIDLNNAAAPFAPGHRSPSDILADLLMQCGDFSPSLRVGALRDFVDEDRDGPRETSFYCRSEESWSNPDRVLYGFRELLHVVGWTEDFVAPAARVSVGRSFDALLADHVTVIAVPRDRPIPININTATREALRAVLGFEQDHLADLIMTLRSIRPIRSTDSLMVAASPETFDRLQPHLDVRSRYFRIRVRAEKAGRRHDVEALAIRGDEGHIRIAQWVEDEWAI